MSIVVFNVLLFIFQIVLLIKAIRKNDKKDWVVLFSVDVLSIVLVVLFFLYTVYTEFIVQSWIHDFEFWGYSVAVLLVYFFMLIIGIITKIVKLIINRKDKDQNLIKNEVKNTSVKKSLITNIVIVIVAFIIIAILPYEIEKFNDRNTSDKAKDEIVNILNKKYGDGDFEVVEMKLQRYCMGCVLSSSNDGFYVYEFTMSSSYLEDNFNISIKKDDFEIYEDDFLHKYYRQKLNKDHLLLDLEHTLNEYYGRIPSLEEIENTEYE